MPSALVPDGRDVAGDSQSAAPRTMAAHVHLLSTRRRRSSSGISSPRRAARPIRTARWPGPRTRSGEARGSGAATVSAAARGWLRREDAGPVVRSRKARVEASVGSRTQTKELPNARLTLVASRSSRMRVALNIRPAVVKECSPHTDPQPRWRIPTRRSSRRSSRYRCLWGPSPRPRTASSPPPASARSTPSLRACHFQICLRPPRPAPRWIRAKRLLSMRLSPSAHRAPLPDRQRSG